VSVRSLLPHSGLDLRLAMVSGRTPEISSRSNDTMMGSCSDDCLQMLLHPGLSSKSCRGDHLLP
jgi:hypothetical protein